MSARMLFALVIVVISACGQDGVSSVEGDRVELDEFSIETAAESWRAGAVSLTVDNVGERVHTLVISDADGHVVATTDIVEPNETLEFDVELEGGSYQLTCRIVVEGGNGQIFDHFEQGMHTTIDVDA